MFFLIMTHFYYQLCALICKWYKEHKTGGTKSQYTDLLVWPWLSEAHELSSECDSKMCNS